MANAFSSRVRPSTAHISSTTDTSARRTGSAGGRHGFGSGYGSGGRGRTSVGIESGTALRGGVITTTDRSFGSSSSSRINSLINMNSSSQRTGGVGFGWSGSGGSSLSGASKGVGATQGVSVVFKSAAARANKHAAYLQQYGRRPVKKSKTKTSLRRHGAEGRLAAEAASSADAGAGAGAILGVAHEHDHHSGRSHEVRVFGFFLTVLYGSASGALFDLVGGQVDFTFRTFCSISQDALTHLCGHVHGLCRCGVDVLVNFGICLFVVSTWPFSSCGHNYNCSCSCNCSCNRNCCRWALTIYIVTPNNFRSSARRKPAGLVFFSSASSVVVCFCSCFRNFVLLSLSSPTFARRVEHACRVFGSFENLTPDTADFLCLRTLIPIGVVSCTSFPTALLPLLKRPATAPGCLSDYGHAGSKQPPLEGEKDPREAGLGNPNKEPRGSRAAAQRRPAHRELGERGRRRFGDACRFCCAP